MAKSKPKKGPMIEYCRIFPAIGIARLGNSPDQYFIGPEVPGDPPDPEGGYKDALGRMKKQAARFRVYGFDAEGRNLGEVTADQARIRWTVALANRKAEWWPFNGTANVEHILEHGQPQASSQTLRNASIEGDARARLTIVPEPCTLEGRDRVAEPMRGEFLDYPDPITLGQCRTDDAGRLVFTGGDGRSDSTRGKDATFLVSYANNDWWFDDTGDGPVTCEVTIGRRRVDVRGGAWVVVAPPDFSPHTKNVVTLYDVFLQSAEDLSLVWPENELGPAPAAEPVSFLEHVYPIIKRTSDYRWVNARALRAHGRDRLADFASFDQLAVLADRELAARSESPQKRVFEHVRDPTVAPDSHEAANQANLSFMPALSGDEGTIRLGAPATWLHLTRQQYERLRRWSEGDFVADLPESAEALRRHDRGRERLADYDVSEQPLALTRAALEACEGGAFFPGIEMTSIVRHRSFYDDAFRVGATLRPGDVTRWMALPWQADFNDCSDNWWPAVRPDDVISEPYFEDIVRQARASGEDVLPLLVRRERWARGVGVRYGGFEFDMPPGLPAALEGMTPEAYRVYAQQTLDRFFGFYQFMLPRRRPREFPASYARRLRNFVSRTIGALELPIESTPIDEVVDLVLDHVRTQLALSAPKPDETIGAYFERLQAHQSEDVVLQGVLDVAWRIQNDENICAKNEMVEAWSELGVVAERELASGGIALVEMGRPKYARRPWREYFHVLMNIEDHPDFIPKAEELAEEFLETARASMRDPVAVNGPLRTYFPYSRAMLDARLETIYEDNRAGAAAYSPEVNPGLFDTEEKIVERIRQLAPFNQLDGGWLQRITPAGNATKLQGLLFRIWMDELGNGDPAQNHANVYTDLMRSAGIYYPPIDTLDYAENPEIWDDMFSGSVYHTAISLFPETYYPELIGMTLYLEWEANDLQRMVDLYEYYGYPSLFYSLHVAIDNTVGGHGAMAKKIVELYLDEVRNESGESGVQEHWERIWTGYIAFAFGGIQRWTYHLNNPRTPRDRVIELIERKRHYGALNHHDKKLGPARINALFYEPAMFLEEIAGSDHVVPGDPDASPLMKLMAPDGVMFRVFNEAEIESWRTWIRSLPAPPDGVALASGDKMVILLRRMAAKGVAAGEHAKFRLKGPDPDRDVEDWDEPRHFVDKTVAWWFQLLRRQRRRVNGHGDLHHVAFMRALANADNGWIVPGSPERSRLVRELLRDGPMGERLRATRPLLGSTRGAEVIVDWIRAGCPDPAGFAVREPKVGGSAVGAAQPRSLLTDSGAKGEAELERMGRAFEETLSLRSMSVPERMARGRNAEPGRRILGPGMGSVQ